MSEANIAKKKLKYKKYKKQQKTTKKFNNNI